MADQRVIVPFMLPDQLAAFVQETRAAEEAKKDGETIIFIGFSDEALEQYEELDVEFTNHMITNFGVSFDFQGVSCSLEDDLVDSQIAIIIRKWVK
jgi:hypothetical protein